MHYQPLPPYTREEAAAQVTEHRQLMQRPYSLDGSLRRGSHRALRDHLTAVKLRDAVLAGCLTYEAGATKTLTALLVGAPACGTVDETLRAVQRRRQDTDTHVASLAPAVAPAAAS